jgi:hypothetical protein
VPSDRIEPIGPAQRGVDPVRPPLLTPLEREQERRRREERRRRRKPPGEPPREDDGRPRLDVRG